MDIMITLVSMCLLFGAIGLYAGIRNHAVERRSDERKRHRFAIAHGMLVCLLAACMPMAAQEVIHAQAGNVVAVNASSRTLVLKLADGSTVVYHDVPSHEPALSFDKAVREKTVPIAAYSKVGANVVVLYFGYDTPTAVAVKELGPDTARKCTGSVASFDRGHHALVLQTEAAQPEKLTLTEDTIVDTNDGVVKLADYKPSKGQRLRCYTSPNSETALLVVPE
jgi:hypothetical protein